MKRSRWIPVFGVLTVAVGLAGCSKSTTATDNSGDDTLVETAKEPLKASPQKAGGPEAKHRPEGRDFHGGMMHGPLDMLRHELDDVGLSDAQKATIDKAFEDAKPEKPADDAKPEAFKAFFDEVAKEVRANAIDEAGLTTKAKALESEHPMDGMRASMAKALQTVHDTLTSDQRAKLASSILDKMSKFDGKDRPDGDRPDGKGRPEGKGMHGPLEMMLHGLDITDEQKTSIQNALDQAGLKPEEKGEKRDMGADMKAMLEAFKGDNFNAATALPQPPEKGGDHFEKMVKALKVIVPLLDEKQRGELADRLEKGPMGMGPGGRGGPEHMGPRGEHHRGHGRPQEQEQEEE